MTKEEARAVMLNNVEKYAMLMAMSESLDDLAKSDEDTSKLYEMLKLCEGQNEYTLKFFPNGDEDFYAMLKNPPDLDSPTDGFSDISERTWLECVCELTWSRLTDCDPKY